MAAGGAIGPGVFVAVVGPSGAGKDTLLAAARHTLASRSDIRFVRRVVTRSADPSEDFEPVAPDRFAAAEAAGAFAISWRAHGHGYGLPALFEADIRAGAVVVANVSRAVVAQARARYSTCRVVLVTAPHELLEARRAARRRVSDKGGTRSRIAREEIPIDMTAADLAIVNDGPIEAAAARLAAYLVAATAGIGPPLEAGDGPAGEADARAAGREA